MKSLLLAVFCFLCASPALAAQDPSRAALEAATQRWTTALNSQDVETLNLLMTEDVQLLDATAATVMGRDAVVKALREVSTYGRTVVTSREITIAGDVAWRVVALTQTQKNGDVHARGQALEIWKRMQGQWKLHRQMAAGLLTRATPLSRPSPTEPVLDRPAN